MHMKVDGSFVWHLKSSSGASVGPVPRSRCKHAACLYDGHAYIYGGKDGNVPLKDLWRFNLSKKWISSSTLYHTSFGLCFLILSIFPLSY